MELTKRLGATTKRAIRIATEENLNGFRDERHQWEPKLSEWPTIVDETFAEIFDPKNARLLPKHERSAFGEMVMKYVRDSDAFKQLKRITRANIALSAEATASLTTGIADVIGVARMKQDADASDDPRKIIRELSTICEALPDDADEIIQAAEKKRKSSMRRRSMMLQRLQQATQSGALEAVMEQTVAHVDQTSQRVRFLREAGLGFGDHSLDGELDLEIVKACVGSERLNQAIDALGRISKTFKIRKAKAPKVGRCDVVDVTTGDDLLSLIPSEQAMLGHPVLKLDLLSRVSQREALCYQQKSDSQYKGDIVMLVDRSGSMSGVQYMWARAVALAVAGRALKQKRRLAVSLFSGSGNRTTMLVEDNSGLAKLIEALKREPNGGTDALGALKDVRQLAGKLRRPDVLVITDGEWGQTIEHEMKDIRRRDATETSATVCLIDMNRSGVTDEDWKDGLGVDSVIHVDSDKLAREEGSTVGAELMEHANL